MKLSLLPAMLVSLLSCSATADDTAVLVTRIYQVADLVVDGPTEESRLLALADWEFAAKTSGVEKVTKKSGKPTVAENLNELAEIVRLASSGLGNTNVTSHLRSRSLVIRATPKGHDAIVELIQDLRSASETSVDVRLEFIFVETSTTDSDVQQASTTESQSDDRRASTSPVDKWIKQHGHQLTPKQVDQFRTAIGQQGQTLHALNCGAVQNGYSHDVYSDYLKAVVTATVSPDRRSSQISLIRFQEYLPTSTSIEIQSGHTAIQQFGAGDEGQFICLITATIVVPEEEEEPAASVNRDAD